MALPSRLQQELADRIVQLVREEGFAVGSVLSENGLARRLEVSRTPVRGALQYLEERGLVVRRANRGVELVAVPADAPQPSLGDDERWIVRIAHDRRGDALPEEVSELEVMRRYGLSRAAVQRILARLAELGMVERKPGYGWRFATGRRDAASHDESYRFRLMIEPRALLEPGFRLDPSWVEDMRRSHGAVVERPWGETSSVSFFEMNAAFHEGLAAGSGNRFVEAAIRRQNQLRRLSQYDWEYGFDRVAASCREHLEILDFLSRGEREVAAELLRRHLERASALRGGTFPGEA